MSAVDVLAVIDRAAGGLFAAQGAMPSDLMQARAAVEKLMADRAELLEALQGVLAMLLEWHKDYPREVGDKELPIVDAARAAIARATGEGNE